MLGTAKRSLATLFVATLLILIVTKLPTRQDAKPPLEFSATCVASGEMTITFGYGSYTSNPIIAKCIIWHKVILDYDGSSRAILIVSQTRSNSVMTCTITKSGFVIAHSETTTKSTLGCST